MGGQMNSAPIYGHGTQKLRGKHYLWGICISNVLTLYKLEIGIQCQNLASPLGAICARDVFVESGVLRCFGTI